MPPRLRLTNIVWFLICGARERAKKTGVFGVFAAGMSFYLDVGTVFNNAVWTMAAVFGGLTLFVVSGIWRLGRPYDALTVDRDEAWPKRVTRSELPDRLHFYRNLGLFSAAATIVLAITGLGQTWAASQGPAPADGSTVSVFATLIPELQGLRGDVKAARTTLESIDRKLDTADPREKLAKGGVVWTVDAFYDAIRRGDAATVRLFVQGGMKPSVPDSQGRSLPVVLALNVDNAGEILDLLVAGGLDVNRAAEVSGAVGKQKMTLLSRAIEKDNFALVAALIRHKASLNDPIQTFGAMGLTRDTFPLASAVTWRRFAIAAALLDAGADSSVGDFAAYREALALRERPGLTSETIATLNPLIARLAPAGAVLGRIDAELRLQAVEKKLNQVAIDGLRYPPGSRQRAAADREYESLQQERQRLRLQLGLPDKSA